MKLKIKKLHPHAVIPKMAHNDDAGLDLTAIDYEYKSDGRIIYRTGIAIEMDTDKRAVAKLYPRSSISKTGLVLANGTGIIDKGYRGEIFVVFRKLNDKSKLYQPGDRIAQLVPQELPDLEVEVTDDLTDTSRGDGGFGSTGK